jgi:hypothetical protein
MIFTSQTKEINNGAVVNESELSGMKMYSLFVDKQEIYISTVNGKLFRFSTKQNNELGIALTSNNVVEDNDEIKIQHCLINALFWKFFNKGIVIENFTLIQCQIISERLIDFNKQCMEKK